MVIFSFLAFRFLESEWGEQVTHLEPIIMGFTCIIVEKQTYGILNRIHACDIKLCFKPGLCFLRFIFKL